MIAASSAIPASASRHYTGPLEWLGASARGHRPPARSSTRDQVEILGGGYYEPVLASLPERDRIGQRRMADELETMFGRRPAARGWRSASGSRTCRRRWSPRATWTILDDAHFRAAAIPRRTLGPYTTEDQGPPAAGLRHGAGPPLPDPVPRGRRGHRLPALARDRRRRPGRDDGRRRREVRGVADDLAALLGRSAAGSSGSSRRSRRTPTG